MTPEAETILHGTAVAIAGRALLITGASGAGKSALALELVALGAGLIADDRTLVTRQVGRLRAAAPPGLPPLIEARGLGLIPVTPHPPAPLALIADLDTDSPARLPDPAQRDILGLAVPWLAVRGVGSHLAAALVLLLKSDYVGGDD